MSTADRPVSRPLSPHLQVYRPQLTSTLSISHRIAGVGLALGLLWLVVWVCAAAGSGEVYGWVAAFNGSVIGRIFLIGWTACLFFHFFNGIRHLFWDAGYGLDLKDAYTSGWTAVVAAAVCTIGSWLIASLMR